ncbi:MAG: folylpolyglutamate synthase/dihydrofolate synthase family protein [Melioribacteraceae bacterium]|nr:bifunctional folylpolyglutamate synthase/dihydrofolate synthase [Melioribacteraceae bacterium]WKZ71194.1 MAG: folylpolyglutamate synthase/dihydrofolate synthase family protein [Melioribacteraceae bacterium]
MNLEESLQKLFSLHQFGIKLGLEKPKQLFNHLSNPQNNLKCFHIAGSNAKGSVSSFITSILMEEGYKVGLYTSPHYVKFNERIRVNGQMIADEYIMSFMNELNEYININEPTFFELTTAMAFKYFAEQKVDFAVIETGLGGRLDATNVIDPIASVITTISLEHTNILGDTLKQIAYEKGEIIKRGRKSFIGLLTAEAQNVLINKANSVNSELYNLREVLQINKDSVTLIEGSKKINLYSTPLIGNYQLKNAALAIHTVINSISFKSYRSIYSGILNVIKNTGIQGRYEIFNENPKIILDSSHNEEGINNFISEFKNEKDNYNNREVIFGVMKDKDIKKMLLQFDNIFDKINITTFEYERAATIEQIKDIADSIGVKVNLIPDPVEYILRFKTETGKKCLVVLGSIYLLGQIKSKLMNKNA